MDRQIDRIGGNEQMYISGREEKISHLKATKVKHIIGLMETGRKHTVACLKGKWLG